MDERPHTMRFCQECLNLLYPSVGAAEPGSNEKQLWYVCRRMDCDYREPANRPVDAKTGAEHAISEPAANTVHSRNMVQETEVNLDIVLPELVEDPTLQRSTVDPCPDCGAQEAVFFQAKQSAKAETLQLIFICTDCRRKWKDEGAADREAAAKAAAEGYA